MILAVNTEKFSLEDFIANPPEHQEWVDGKLVETKGITIKHSRIQSKLSRYWGNYLNESGQGGDVGVELPCQTTKQGRRPDVAYLTPEILEQFEDIAVLPQSPPLIAEIASPSDAAEDLFAKAEEYLQSSCQEVWLVFPESMRILIITPGKTLAFSVGDEISTQTALLGFQVSVAELLG
ncbi:Uma2 family endonuclease [[Phormidium] sp. ETS-05]|uniref:Uma2 family endonuclease n=1 Tax=[Phormidium] sp. ETS-05 TaxID=222819 RepID=UPI0018EF1422|nr:Uma2 family endonuclease [[Phormidium] sp. ETS-05]